MPISTGNEYGIQDVWSSNMEEEFAKIRKIVNKYSYIAMVRIQSVKCALLRCRQLSYISSRWNYHSFEYVFLLLYKMSSLSASATRTCWDLLNSQDTEFPGVVARPIGEFRSTSDYQYQLLRCNVDLLKLIQVGLSFCDEDGNPPPPPTPSTWQFNFKFSLT